MESQPSSFLSSRSLLLILVGILLGSSITGISFYLWMRQQNINTPVEITQPLQTPTPAYNENINKRFATDTLTPLAVTWLSQPEKISSPGFFSLIDKLFPYSISYCKDDRCSENLTKKDTYETHASYYRVGTVKDNPYKGGTVILAIVQGLPRIDPRVGSIEKNITYDYKGTYLFIHMPDNRVIVTNDYKNKSIFCQESSCQPIINTSDKTGLQLIWEGALATDPVSTQWTYEPIPDSVEYNMEINSEFLDTQNHFLVKDFGNGYQLYTLENIKEPSMNIKVISSPSLMLRLPTGIKAQLYGGNYDFVVEQGSDYGAVNFTQITWTNRDKPLPLLKKFFSEDEGSTAGIRYAMFYGCQGAKDASKLPTIDPFIERDLLPVATSQQGDVFYTFKNPDTALIKSVYQLVKKYPASDYILLDKTPLSEIDYERFLKLYPILVWKNPLRLYQLVQRANLHTLWCWNN